MFKLLNFELNPEVATHPSGPFSKFEQFYQQNAGNNDISKSLSIIYYFLNSIVSNSTEICLSGYSDPMFPESNINNFGGCPSCALATSFDVYEARF